MKKAFLISILVLAIVNTSCAQNSKDNNVANKLDREKLSQALEKYDEYKIFSEGLAMVRKNDKHGFFNWQF